jgi:hypothetical protein
LKPLILTLIVAFSLSLAAHAQTPVASLPPAHLEPIEFAPGSSIMGSVFFYKGRKLHAPFSVEVPIQELNDPVANLYFRRFRTWTTVGRLTGLASVAYVLLNRTPDRQTSRAVYIGSVVASVGFSMISNYQVNKAVQRYNAVVGAPQVGVSVVPTVGNRLVAGVGVVLPLLR